MAKQNKQTKNKKGAPRKKQLKSNFPTKKEEIVAKDGVIVYEEGITVGQLADKIGQTPANVIKVLFLLGTMVTINSSLNDEQVELICLEYGFEVEKHVEVSEVNFEEIDIQDDDYGLWYMDALDHPYKYDGKVVRIKGKVVHIEKDNRSFVMGRYAMVCCAEDTSLIGYLCKSVKPVKLVMNEWITLTARIVVEYDEEYQRNLVVPHAQAIEPAEELQDDLVYFS